jgi:capsid portal protein
VGKKPPYDPDLLSQFVEKNETHSVAIRKKARYEVGYGFDLAPVGVDDPDEANATQRAVARDFWFSRDSRWQTGPRQRAEPTVPEEVLELARQDFHAVGWCALEILTDNMGRPVGLAHVPANTIRVRTPQSEYDRTRHPETGSFADGDLGDYASRGYVQVRHGKRRYYGEAGDRYRGQEVSILGDADGDGDPEVRYLDDAGDDREPIFVDKETGDVAVGGAGALDNEPANELIFMRNPSVLPEADAYGVPDWVSAIRTMVGDEAAKDYNRTFFENDTIPRFVIKVTGGTLSEESKKDLKKMLRNLRAEDHRALILEVDKFADGLQEDVEIELEPLGQGVTEEMSFSQYRERNEHLVSQVHEVPPVVLGITETSNRSNSDAQLHSFATEVIQPEQHKFAERLYRLIHQTALGVTDWTVDFRLRGADQPREDARTAAEKIQAVNGAIPVNRALQMIGEDPLDADSMDFDPNTTLLANVGDVGATPGGDVEAADGRHAHAPPIGNKLGERDWQDVKAELETKDPLESANFDSSNLDQGIFDFGENELYISFLRDAGQSSLYVYTDVPTAEWSSLQSASSKGGYHYDSIRLEYPYWEITNFHSRLPEGEVPDELPENIPEGI